MQPTKNQASVNDSSDIYPDRETLLKIMDHMYDELYVIDHEGVCIYVNRACLKHYGIKPEEIIGQDVWESSGKGYFSPPIGPIVLKTKKIATFEQKSNTNRNLLVTATPVFDGNGDLEMVVENLRDITALNQVKNDLRSTKELLYRYQRELEVFRKEDLSVDFIAHSKVMQDILTFTSMVARSDTRVLITGQTGTGKGVLARHIHRISKRKNGPFITVNCAALPEQLFESEIYGYKGGAFTGANPKGKLGLIDLTGDGTLFLDDISEISPHHQAKLLQVVQEGQYIPVGGDKYKTVGCRILAATNQDLSQLVKAGQFRSDLYYRLKTIEIDIPPLKERQGDMVPLIQFFLKKYDAQNASEHYFEPETIERLCSYEWPGNVRELEHVIERLVVTTPESSISLRHLPSPLRGMEKRSAFFPEEDLPLDEALNRFQRDIVLSAYRQLGSSYKVARKLQISQSRAYRLIQMHLQKEDDLAI